MNNSSYPSITIVIPTFNEEKRIERCLKSIFEQDYLLDKLQVIVIDDSSTDQTVKLAKKFPVEILTHNSSDAEVGKRIAFQKAKGELFTYIDADVHLRGIDWLKKMVRPLIEDKSIVASFTRYCSDNHSSAIERFLNLDPIQRDPVLEFFSAGFKNIRSENYSGYAVFHYDENHMLPEGRCIHRYKKIKHFVKGRRFHELNLIADLVLSGERKFAYVESAGLFHHHAENLLQLLLKRKRNVTRVYLGETEERRFKWFNLNTAKGIAKLIFWIVWANLFIPSCLKAVYKALNLRTLVVFYEPLVSLLITDVFLISFLTDLRGLKLVFKLNHFRSRETK